MIEHPSYHFLRARDEIERSRTANDAGAAASHRALSILHLGKLINSADLREREEAATLLSMLDNSTRGESDRAGHSAQLWASPRSAAPGRTTLRLRFAD